MAPILGKNRTASHLTVLVVLAAMLATGMQTAADAHFMSSVAAAMLLALALDIAWGYAGVLSLGHAILFGVPAYTTAILAKNGVTSFLLLAVIAAASAALLAALIGKILFSGRRKLSPLYVVMATLALSYAAERVAHTWSYVGADTGIPGLARPTLFGLSLNSNSSYLVVCLATVYAIFTLLRWLISGQWRIPLTGIRENESRIDFLGYNVAKIKIQAFVLSGAVAGLGGFLYVFNLRLASPGILGIDQSTIALVWVLTGGVGTLVGPVLGAFGVEYVAHWLSGTLLGWWQIVLGAILLVVIVLVPRGLVGILDSFLNPVMRRLSHRQRERTEAGA